MRESISDAQSFCVQNQQTNTPALGIFASSERSDQPRSGLDLIFGHLTTRTYKYAPVTRNTPDGTQPEGWFRPSGEWLADEQSNLVLKVQPFEAGGFEATLRSVCLPDLARMLDAPKKTGKREAPDELDEVNQLRSIQRSKQKARYLIKSMGADRLLTLTRRECDASMFWSLDDWANAWARFCRLCNRAGYGFDYVAIPEHHKKGNYHLHVALNARCNINLVRSLWWACCGGRGQGNVDISYKKHLTSTSRLAGIARYLTKYLTKQFGQTEFNKKRYWSSRHKLPSPVRVVLATRDIGQALAEVCDLLQLDYGRVLTDKVGAYIYPSRDKPEGFWLNWSEQIQGFPF